MYFISVTFIFFRTKFIFTEVSFRISTNGDSTVNIINQGCSQKVPSVLILSAAEWVKLLILNIK